MSDKEDEFLKGIQSTDRRTQLETLRDLVAHQLTANRCSECKTIEIRQSDIAALVLRLQKILDELESIPEQTAEKTPTQQIQERVAKKAAGMAGNVVYPFGTKEAPRRKGIGRRPSVKGDD